MCPPALQDSNLKTTSFDIVTSQTANLRFPGFNTFKKKKKARKEEKKKKAPTPPHNVYFIS